MVEGAVEMELWLAAFTLVSVIAALVFTRFSATAVFFTAALFCLVSGLIDVDDFWAKTTNEGLVTLVLLLLCAIALERLPWLGLLSRGLDSANLPLTIGRIVLIAAPMSAVLNNTAVVAALAQVLRKSTRHPPSRLLLPLSYAAILGGTLTLIGTSTNLIVSSFIEDQRGYGFDFGDFFVVSAPVVVFILGLIILLAWRLPNRQMSEAQTDEYTLEAEVDIGGPLVGLSVQDAGLRALETIYMTEIVRGARSIYPVSPREILQAGDRLVFAGDVVDVTRLDRVPGLSTFAQRQGLMKESLTEVLISPGSMLDGRSPRELGFRARFDAAIVGVQREGRRVSGRIGEMSLNGGDLLVLAAGDDFSARKNLRRNFLLLSDDVDVRLMSTAEGIAATLALLAVIGLSAFGRVNLSVGLLVLLAVFWATSLVSIDDLRRRFPFDIWILVASALALAHALIESQLVATVVSFLLPTVLQSSPFIGLVFIFLSTLLLTELVTNNAAAALMFPIAFALAEALGVNIMPYALAVAFAASGSFLTPYGYATNLIVQNLAGYTRADYFRFGWPISLAYSAGMLVMLHITYFT